MFDFLLSFNADWGPKLVSTSWHILIFTILIGILVAVHEFGHFIVAKWCGVGVIKFSLGFGPAIWKKRFGETIYQVCWVPLGGFVRLVGDIPDPLTGEQPTDDNVRGEDLKKSEKDEEDDLKAPEIQAMINDHSRWFIEKGFWARTLIVFAGPLFNLLLAFVVYTITAGVYGEASLRDAPVIGSVDANSPAAVAGIQGGDTVVSIDGQKIEKWSEVAERIHKSEGQSLNIVVKRAAEEKSLVVMPQPGEVEDELTRKAHSFYFIGIKRKELLDRKPIPIWYSPVSGLVRTGYLTIQTYVGLWKMVTGQISAKNLAGPIFIF